MELKASYFELTETKTLDLIPQVSTNLTPDCSVTAYCNISYTVKMSVFPFFIVDLSLFFMGFDNKKKSIGYQHRYPFKPERIVVEISFKDFEEVLGKKKMRSEN